MAFLANIRLSSKVYAGTNTLAYSLRLSVTKKKNPETLTLGRRLDSLHYLYPNLLGLLRYLRFVVQICQVEI